MKKVIFFSFYISILLSLSGCAFPDIVEQYLPDKEISSVEEAETQSRVYIDKITGTLIDFTGSQLTLRSDKTDYIFDISNASIECENGIISGDEISLIYEGQFENNDTSTIKILKVVDEYPHKNELEERSGRGMVQSLTANTITITTKKGNTVTFPTTGTKQYYENGISEGDWVYVTFKGFYVNIDPNTPNVLNGSQMKVLSISDVYPLKNNKPEATEEDHTLSVIIQNIQMNQLTVLPINSDASFVIDITDIYCYFPGGIAPGSTAKIIYQGTFDGYSTNGMTIRSITGQNPKKTKPSKITSTVSGTILGTTANTVSIRTFDGAFITCNTTDVENTTSYGLEIGCTIKITFNPAASSTSTIYTALKFEDA